MARQVVTRRNIARLVEHMFDEVFTESERAELLVWIHRWEHENPDVDAAHRVTGWIDVAYSFQARMQLASESTTPIASHEHPTGATLSFA